MTQTNNLVIRESRPEEFSAIAQLCIEAYQEYAEALTPPGWEAMKAILSQVKESADLGEWLVAEMDDRRRARTATPQLVGAVVYFPPGNSDGIIFPVEWASLRALAVSPDRQGQGIGKRLLKECIERAKRDRASHLGLHTTELMINARKMYEHMGFQQDIELPPQFGVRYWRYVLAPQSPALPLTSHPQTALDKG